MEHEVQKDKSLPLYIALLVFLFVAVVVGFLAIAILSAVFSATSAMGH